MCRLTAGSLAVYSGQKASEQRRGQKAKVAPDQSPSKGGTERAEGTSVILHAKRRLFKALRNASRAGALDLSGGAGGGLATMPQTITGLWKGGGCYVTSSAAIL